MVVVDFERTGDGFRPIDRSWRFNPISSIPMTELKKPKITNKKRKSGYRGISMTGLNESEMDMLRKKSSKKKSVAGFERLPTNSDLGNRRNTIKVTIRIFFVPLH